MLSRLNFLVQCSASSFRQIMFAILTGRLVKFSECFLNVSLLQIVVPKTTSVFAKTNIHRHSHRHTSVSFSPGDALDEMRSFSNGPSPTPSMDPSPVNRVVDSTFCATSEMVCVVSLSIVPRAFRVVFLYYTSFDPIHLAHPYHLGLDGRS